MAGVAAFAASPAVAARSESRGASAAQTGPPPVATPQADAPASVQSLHEPGVRSHFAYVNRPVVARAQPDAASRRVGRLTLRTEDGTHELVQVLARTAGADGRGAWLNVRMPVRPNGTTGWVPAAALSDLQPVRTWLIIDTRRFRATLIRAGRTAMVARVGVGHRRSPTPRGDFYIRHKLRGYGSAGSFYGPVAFGTNARSEHLTDWPGGAIVGIHGTSRPGLLPGRVSHGCVRLSNRDILRLERLMPVGTPVTIR